MNRLFFISRLIALGGLSFLSGKTFSTKQYQKFYLLQSFIRGFQYYEGPSLINQMNEGDLLELVREPDNEYDPCAIALHWNKHKIGFIPAEDNEMLSKLLDIGIPEFIAEITFLQKEAAAWENVSIAISVLKEIPLAEQIPSTAVYLTELETPHYRTLKRADQTLTRVFTDNATDDVDLITVNAADYLDRNGKSLKVKKMIDDSLNRAIDYGAQVDFLVVNKNELRNKPGIRDQLGAFESDLYNAEAMFDKKGYMVLSIQKAEGLVDQISSLSEVADKLGRRFLELKFE
jgi:HIRAN domain